MAEKPSEGNFFTALAKFLLFLAVFCLAAAVTRQFILTLHAAADVDTLLLPGTAFFVFSYYLLIKDLNEPYKKLQTFFFRTPRLSYVLPFLLPVAAAVFFALIKFRGMAINREIFVFVGAFIVVTHLLYVSSDTKGESFGAFSGYLLNLNLFYLANLLLLGLYFNVVFNFNVLKVLWEGLRVSGEGLVAAVTVGVNLISRGGGR